MTRLCENLRDGGAEVFAEGGVSGEEKGEELEEFLCDAVSHSQSRVVTSTIPRATLQGARRASTTPARLSGARLTSCALATRRVSGSQPLPEHQSQNGHGLKLVTSLFCVVTSFRHSHYRTVAGQLVPVRRNSVQHLMTSLPPDKQSSNWIADVKLTALLSAAHARSALPLLARITEVGR